VERHRTRESAQSEVASAFVGWGIPTAESLVKVRWTCPGLPLIASGGVADGVEAALCLALGANLVGMAGPLLRPAAESAEAVIARLKAVIKQLRVAMFCSGARTIADLDRSRVSVRS